MPPRFTKAELRAEQWLPIGGNREVSDLGRVRVAVYSGTRRPGTPRTPDRIGGVLTQFVVLEAFVGPRPHSGAKTRHADGDTTNNRLANLSWVVPGANPPGGCVTPFVGLLGKLSDVEVAKLAGCNRERVRQVRDAHGIARLPLETAFRRRRDLATPAALLDLLGRVSDSEIAERFGVGSDHVRRLRLDRGIPAWTRPNGTGRLAPYVHLLGTIPDAQIARSAGVCAVTVLQLRRRLGVAPFPYDHGKGRARGA